MRNPSYLIKSRHNVYYFRFPLPYDPERSRVSISLGTRCPKQALRYAKELEYHSCKIMDCQGITAMHKHDLTQLLKGYYSELLDGFKQEIDTNGALSTVKRQMVQDALESTQELINKGTDTVDELTKINPRFKLRPDQQNTTAHQEVKKMMDSINVNFLEGSQEYQFIKNALKHFTRNHFKDILEYNDKLLYKRCY